HQDNMRTKLLTLSANIDKIKILIPQDKTFSAILPKYPDDERGIVLDYSGLRGDGDLSYWKNLTEEITSTIDRELMPLLKKGDLPPLSIFAIGPIPLLIHLGATLGKAIPADIYQLHRDTEDWKWKDEMDKNWNGYSVIKHRVNEKGHKVA